MAVAKKPQDLDKLIEELQDFLLKNRSEEDLYDELKSLLEDIDQPQQIHDLNITGSQSNYVKGEHIAIDPNFFGKVVANAANLTRFAYALDDLNENISSNAFNNAQGINIKYTIDEKRKITDVNDAKQVKIIDFFEQTLGRYRSDLIDNIKLIHSYQVEKLGGTSYVATYDKTQKDKKDVTFQKWIIVGFRGTHHEWLHTDLNLDTIPYKPLCGPLEYEDDNEWYKDFHVHRGFYNALSTLTPHFNENDNRMIVDDPNEKIGPTGSKSYNIFKDVQELIKGNENYKLVIVGHSLGGALASLFGYEAQALGWNPTVITLASPRVGAYVAHNSNARALHFDKIYKLFGINNRDDYERKFDAIKDGNVQEIFDPKKSYFINIINDGDLVPYIPSVAFRDESKLSKVFGKLGGFPVYISTKNSKNAGQIAPEQEIYLLKEDKDLYENLGLPIKDVHAAFFGIIPDFLDEISRLSFYDLFTHRKEYEAKGRQLIMDLIDFFQNSGTNDVGFWEITSAMIFHNRSVYDHHVFYGLYYISYEYGGAGVRDFPVSKELDNNIGTGILPVSGEVLNNTDI